MSNNSIHENFSELQEAVQGYVEARINYYKITLIEKAAKVGTYMFSSTLILFSVLFIFLLLALAFSFWYASNIGSISEGLLISAGVFALLSVIAYLLRRKLFANSIVRNIASVLYDDEDKEDKQNRSL
ncbi:MAG: hypothetical protein V2I34_12355 [Bacteroidales bacterium]|jgi:hypothetical protein|nr:hypothetical protein [Bacteroidales bacterium]